MPELNDAWVNEQLGAAKVKVASGKAILKLLEAWKDIPELAPAVIKEVLEVFPKLAQGHVVVEPELEDDFFWVDLQPGQITVGDTVRVKTDAFTDKLGVIHNGRVGKVTAVRYGDVILNSTDGKQPVLNGVHYSPYKLEKRFKKA